MKREDRQKVKPKDDHAEFVMSFVDDSAEGRDAFEDIWEEVEENFLVRPFNDDSGYHGRTGYPLNSIIGSGGGSRGNLASGQAILKDPETHQSVMTIVSKIVLATMGEPGFVKAKPVGGEDVYKGQVVSKLLEYTERLPGHFWKNVEWILSACLYGTGWQEVCWKYEEGPREFRSTDIDEFGVPISYSETLIVPTYDDVQYRTVHPRDMYPDQSASHRSEMKGAAKCFRVTAAVARKRAEDGMYDSEAVERAIHARMEWESQQRMRDRDETGMDPQVESHPDFMEMIGYEYFGHTPFESPDGVNHRVITVLGGETVRSEPWPRPIPFFDIRLTPRLGSMWGISPAEVMRYDQDFADVLKMMMADAVVRSVHGVMVVNENSGVDMARLMRYRPGVPVTVRGNPREAFDFHQMQGNIGESSSMYGMLKGHMREGGGALGAIQGLGLGSKRFSATEAQQTFAQALDRPELWAQVVERDALPDRGKYVIGLYQSYLDDEDGELQRRVGETQFPVSLGDILPEFDVEYVGSRQEGNDAQMLQAFREIAAAGQTNPILAQMMPWQLLIQRYFSKLGAHEIAAAVAAPEIVQLNMLLQRTGILGPGAGNGNGEAAAAPPVGMMPAQQQGSTL